MEKGRKDVYLIQTMLVSLISACIIFGYFIFKSGGFFTVVDDFNSQQLPFATAVWNMFHSGDAGEWSWNIDLGSSFITTFSFYDLGSPFIWLSLLAPRGVFPYLAGFLYIIKYVTAATTAYLYLRLFVDKRQWAVIGALVYAFSGYQTTNLEFFYFHDVVAVFPLLLWGLEVSMKDRKYRPAFILTIFINCLLNYFFFVGEVVFLVIYYLVRYRKLPVRQFVSGIFTCALCGVLGVGMAAILFFPNILYVLGNSRGQSKLYLENLVYDSAGFLHIVKGLLFPGESMREFSAVIRQKWASTSAYLPFFGVSLVFAYVKGKKKTWLSNLLWILGIISLFPLSESIFLLFSESSQRWWYMFVLVLALATAKVLENTEDYPVIKASMLYATILSIFYFTIRFVKWNANGDSIVYDTERFTLFYLIALAGPLIFCVLKRLNWNSYKNLLAFTMCGCILTTALTLHFYRSAGSDSVEGYKENFEAGLQLKTIDEQYRYNSVDNELMINGEAAGIGVFCTTVENSSRKFDSLFGHYSDNSTQNKYDVPGLSELLAGKYEIARDSGDKKILDTVIGGNATFYITERNACPIGFAVDFALTEEEFTAMSQEQKALTLMQAAIVGEDDFAELDDVVIRAGEGILDYEASIDELVAKTVANKVSEFHRDSHGFTCTVNYERGRLLYFTVPWNDGWKATVDGSETKVINSGGMMALKVPAGEHQIVFAYHTPGFYMGALVSVASFCIFVGFMIVNKKRRRVDYESPSE